MPETTTGHVRAAFAWVDNYPHEGFESDVHGEAFDRWLAGVKASAWREGFIEGLDADGSIQWFDEMTPNMNPYGHEWSSSDPEGGTDGAR